MIILKVLQNQNVNKSVETASHLQLTVGQSKRCHNVAKRHALDPILAD